MNFEFEYKRVNKLSRSLAIGLGRQMNGLVSERKRQENKQSVKNLNT